MNNVVNQMETIVRRMKLMNLGMRAKYVKKSNNKMICNILEKIMKMWKSKLMKKMIKIMINNRIISPKIIMNR